MEINKYSTFPRSPELDYQMQFSIILRIPLFCWREGAIYIYIYIFNFPTQDTCQSFEKFEQNCQSVHLLSYSVFAMSHQIFDISLSITPQKKNAFPLKFFSFWGSLFVFSELVGNTWYVYKTKKTISLSESTITCSFRKWKYFAILASILEYYHDRAGANNIRFCK